MAKYDFDRVPLRVGTGSYKWDEYPGTLPLWVADMDFPTAPCVTDALRRRVDHGVFGYTLVRDEYYEALTGWFSHRHGFSFDRGDVIYTSGVVPALSAVIKALCKPGDGVIVMTPVYNCFFSSIRNNGCVVTECPMLRSAGGDGREFSYRIDFNSLEELASRERNTMLLLCNPHNPGGRVWSREELTAVADICRRHNVNVVSDEIHCELTMPGYEYVSYGTVDPQAVVCVSPSKAFNTAGLQIANIITADAGKRALIDRAININEVCDVNPFGVEALIASYSPEGLDWLEALKAYLTSNWEYTCRYIAEHWNGAVMARLEATYLPWIDVTGTPLGLTGSQTAGLIADRCRVKVNGGDMYGDDRFIRLNTACTRAMLEEALGLMTPVINNTL